MATNSATGATVAADVMTREVKTIPWDATLRDVAEMLSIHHISGAPVVDDSGKMTGIICEADLINAAKKRAALPHVAAFGVFLAPEETLKRIYQDGATLRAEQVMTRDVITAAPDTPLAELSRIMTRKRINRIPVLDGEELVGIVTREDVLRGLFGLDNAEDGGAPS
jgi:CBS-domain-containing membrane protein